MKKIILIHYGEIALKGKNKSFFENMLIRNIKKKVNEEIKKYRGYFELVLNKDSNIDELSKTLKTIFGIENFCICNKTEPTIESIQKTLLNIAKKEKTFKIKTKRADKKFLLTSLETNIKLGMFLEQNGFLAELENPEYYIYVNIQRNGAYIYTKKQYGLGGLPVGVSGMSVCLFSGGIDSPVAAYSLMKRGCKIILVHFYRNLEIDPKLLDLVEVLKIYDPDIVFKPINFKNIQDNIIMNVSSKYRLLLYRRFMFRLAYEIARKYNAKSLCTGENLGQVASQTSMNMFVCAEPILNKINVFRPLIAMDKKEIIEKAKEIGTYELSILPYEECCSFLIPKHPETHARLKDILEYEENLDVEKLVKETI